MRDRASENGQIATQMIRWAPYAIVRVTVFFLLGILLAIYSPVHDSLSQVQLLTALFVMIYTLLWVLFRRGYFVRFNVFLSLSGFLAFAALGYLNLISSDQTHLSNHISKFKNMEAYTFTISDNGEEKAKTIRYKAQIQSVKDGIWHPAKGKMLLYVSKGEPSLSYGATYIMPGQPQLLQPPMNPEEFDYKRFLSFQNVHYQQFTKEAPQLLAKDTSFTLAYLGYSISQWAQSVFEKNINDRQDRGIALALVLGVRDDLNNTIRNAYSVSGAMHVLAVSGLHVGIVYLILSALLGKLQASTTGRWIFASLVIAALWMYALVTGFSPSVLRAVTMFSFVILAKAINRKSNIYNTLAASALVLLLFDPYLIMSVGFQLSYLAVIGIVFMQPKIYNLILVNNVVLDRAWAITSVSIAAQVATFPLGLLYFHRFPTLFLLSNLVVIPGAFAILILGILLLFASWIPYLASAIGFILGFLVSIVNAVIFWIESISFSRIDNIYISTGQSWVIILLVFGAAIFLITKRIKLFYAFFGLLVILNFSILNRLRMNKHINKLTFYKINGHTAIDWITDGQSMFWSDKELLNDPEKMSFHISPNRLKSGVRHIKVHSFVESSVKGIELASMANKRVLLLRDVNKKLSFTKKPSVDFLIYTGDCRQDLEWVKNNFDFELLILGSDLYRGKAKELLERSIELELPFYSIYHNGAFEHKI
ncbi:MAG: ComEC/Rec2 family competence protein [Bacteroidota bacterium]